MTAVFARREQREWSRFYLCGQLSNLERKTMEPMVLARLIQVASFGRIVIFPSVIAVARLKA